MSPEEIVGFSHQFSRVQADAHPDRVLCELIPPGERTLHAHCAPQCVPQHR